jgi:hypothetical protein
VYCTNRRNIKIDTVGDINGEGRGENRTKKKLTEENSETL